MRGEHRQLSAVVVAVVGATVAAAAAGSAVASDAPAAGVSFRTDVMAVLSKAGCNAGTCHGNRNGKGGLKLSLRGEDPNADYQALTREHAARRASLLDPEQSLLLLKPTLQVPHEGGRRFARGSQAWATLRDWIDSGMPAETPGAGALERLEVVPRDAIVREVPGRLQILARAQFSTGITRDVTSVAVYEPVESQVAVSDSGLVESNSAGESTIVVRYLNRQTAIRVAFAPSREGYAWLGPAAANDIDEHVFARLKALELPAAHLCTDADFLRRACLDLHGRLPTIEEVRRFAADSRFDKRARLVDALLDDPGFADYWSLYWADLLRCEEKSLDRKGVANYHAWIRQSLAQGRPLDQFVRDLVVSRGSTYTEPAANYYRALRDPFARAEATAQLFLGIRLQCAKCHNHPFDRWTQEDYLSWAALFANIEYRIVENKRRDENDQHEFNGEQIVIMARGTRAGKPPDRVPRPPRFLGESQPVADGADRLVALAVWITGRENRQFARAQVNRVWQRLMGRGLVEPVDDFRDTNPASHPELLDALAHDFVGSGFDLRHLIRTIMASHVYQLAQAADVVQGVDGRHYAHAQPRRLSAEQLLDALAQVTEVSVHFAGYPPGLRAVEIPGVAALPERDRPLTAADRFLRLFGKPPRLQACDCERTDEPTLDQALQLTSGRLLNELITDSRNRIGRLLAASASPGTIVDELYLAALGREPTDHERQTIARLLARSPEPRTTLEDVAWGLLNSNEFLMRP